MKKGNKYQVLVVHVDPSSKKPALPLVFHKQNQLLCEATSATCEYINEGTRKYASSSVFGAERSEVALSLRQQPLEEGPIV